MKVVDPDLRIAKSRSLDKTPLIFSVQAQVGHPSTAYHHDAAQVCPDSFVSFQAKVDLSPMHPVRRAKRHHRPVGRY